MIWLILAGYWVGWYGTAVGLGRRAHEWVWICSGGCLARTHQTNHTSRCVRRLHPMRVPSACALALVWPLVLMYAAVVWGAKPRKAVDYELIEKREKELGLGE